MTNMEPNKGEIVMYQPDETIRLEVRMDGETVWLSQAQMAELFKSSRTNVVEHIQHIYEDEELVENLTCRKFRQVRQEGKRMVEREIPMYNLDKMLASLPQSTPASSRNSSNSTYNATTNSIRLSLSTSVSTTTIVS